MRGSVIMMLTDFSIIGGMNVILDCMKNAGLYAHVVEGLEELLAAEAAYAARPEAEGGERIHGDAMFINDCRYETKPVDADARSEAHRKYIDVMYMIDGEETIYVKPTDRLRKVTQPYDASIEALLANLDGDETAVRLQAGQFIVLFPQDAHCPARSAGEDGPVHKLIGKLAVDYRE